MKGKDAPSDSKASTSSRSDGGYGGQVWGRSGATYQPYQPPVIIQERARGAFGSDGIFDNPFFWLWLTKDSGAQARYSAAESSGNKEELEKLKKEYASQEQRIKQMETDRYNAAVAASSEPKKEERSYGFLWWTLGLVVVAGGGYYTWRRFREV